MSGIEGSVPETPAAPVETPAVPEAAPQQQVAAPDPDVISLKELGLTRQEFDAEVEKFRNQPQQSQQQQHPYSPDSLAAAFANAIKPLVPQPPAAAKIYESEDFFSDKRVFLEGMKQLIAEHLDPVKSDFTKQLTPFQQQMQQVNTLLPLLYARSAENPQFGTINARATAISNKYGVPFMTALTMAQDEIGKQVQKGVVAPPRPPSHATTPDTRQTSSNPDGADIIPGDKADMREIVRGLRATGKF